MQWRQGLDNGLERVYASYLVATVADQWICVLQILQIVKSSRETRRPNDLRRMQYSPGRYRQDHNAMSSKEILLNRFVAVQLSMGSRTPHNKEKGQYLRTKSGGTGKSTACRILFHTNT